MKLNNPEKNANLNADLYVLSFKSKNLANILMKKVFKIMTAIEHNNAKIKPENTIFMNPIFPNQ